MSKLFGIHISQEDLVKKYCFDKCGKILFGGLIDKDIGFFYGCDENKCPYEEKRLNYGMVGYKKFYLRKLKEAK